MDPSKVTSRAVPWLRHLVAGLSPRRPGFAHVGFVEDKMELRQFFFSELFGFPQIYMRMESHSGMIFDRRNPKN
jgi:hypothetical protein